MATPVFGIEDNDIDKRCKTCAEKKRLRPKKISDRRREEDEEYSCAVARSLW
jgi:hypothetical protein